jgi:FecR-like protein
MKKALIILFLISVPFIYANEIVSISYIDGWVDIKEGSGDIYEAMIGDEVMAGNSIMTDEDSYAELVEKSSRSTYNLSPNTVFTVREMETEGKKQNVLACTLGEVAFKFKRAGTLEPLIATNSTVAGVRGTEFKVYAGLDGSSLIAVRRGLVEVESEGVTVALGKNEAVEIKPGEAPGDKFSLKGRPLNFNAWNGEKKKEFLKNPAESLKAVEKRLDYYNSKVEELYPIFLEWDQQRREELREFEKIKKEKGIDEAKKYRNSILFLTMNNASNLILNVRYYALSILSMKRYIVANMYADIKTRYINKLDDPVFKDFEKVYKSVLEKYEKITIPQLNETDI